jgi:hypothetical protein
MNYFLLNPLNHIKFSWLKNRFLKKYTNKIIKTYLKRNYNRYKKNKDQIVIKEFSIDDLDMFLNINYIQKKEIEPIRDTFYFKWRILQSPDRDKYKIIRLNDNNNLKILAKFNEGRNKSIDILIISDLEKKKEIIYLISNLAIWAMERDFSIIRLYTSRKELFKSTARSLKPIIRNPGFCFYSKDKSLLDICIKKRWNWQLIDSDMEWTN